MYNFDLKFVEGLYFLNGLGVHRPSSIGFFFFFFLIIFFYLYLVRCGIFPLDVKFYLNRIIRELFMQSKSVEVKDSSINPNFFFSVYPLIINIGKDKVL